MKADVNIFLLIVMLFATSTPLIAQSLVLIEPNTAQPGQSLGVAITGQNTHFDQATTMLIWFSQGSSTVYAYGYYPIDDTFLIAWFDFPSDVTTGLQDLNVSNDIDGTLTLYDSFMINQGDIVSINPNTAQQGQSLMVAISGQGTHFSFQQGSGTLVWFGQGSTTSVWPVSDTLLFARFDISKNAATGPQDISVYNDIDGTLTFYDSFTITPYNPTLLSITPGGAYQGQKLSVRITGQNTSFEQGSGSVAWLSQGNSLIVSRQTKAIGEKFYEPGSGIAVIADFDIPADANSGMWDVHTFGEIDGKLTLTNSFMIVQPGDWTSDGVVNFLDLAVIAEHWMEVIEE